MGKIKNILTEKEETERLKNTKNFNVKLTLEEAEKLRGTLTKHSTAVVMEKVQRQILSILDNL